MFAYITDTGQVSTTRNISSAEDAGFFSFSNAFPKSMFLTLEKEHVNVLRFVNEVTLIHYQIGEKYWGGPLGENK